MKENSIPLLLKYTELFRNLHRNHNARHGYAPHKPLLILAMLEQIEAGIIIHNLVRITPELVATFHKLWSELVTEDSWVERIDYPFRYLIYDNFWELIKDSKVLSAEQLGHPTSLKQLISKIDEGRFAADLWTLLQDKSAIKALRSDLLKTYFTKEESNV